MSKNRDSKDRIVDNWLLVLRYHHMPIEEKEANRQNFETAYRNLQALLSAAQKRRAA